MKVFDKDGNFLGEFIEDSKDKISDSFDESVGNGCITFLYMILIIVIVAIVWYIFKGIVLLFKFILRILWWIIRTPFCLIFRKEWPRF